MHLLMQARAVDLEACLARAITNKAYHTPTVAELSLAEELFERTLCGQGQYAELTTNWGTLGFEFQEVATPQETLWLLSEPVGSEHGRGWYLFRQDAPSAVVLQAPHARNDIHTGVISLRLFLAGQARALAASTITRHRADMARLENTFFHAFTLAFARACPTAQVAQLHGFDTQNHDNLAADIIVSAGTRSPEPWLTDLGQGLGNVTALTVLTYPKDTRALGATLNAQGRALQQMKHARFVHLELSMKLRELLTHDDALCRAILNELCTANTR